MSDPPTYYAIVLHNTCSDEGAQFILDKLQAAWEDGGAGLTVRRQHTDMALPETVLHVTATPQLVVKIADIMEIKKPDLEGYIRPVTVDELDEFPESGRVGPLNLADIQRCVLHAMERVHFDKETTELPGHPGRTVMKASPVLDAYEEKKLITTFPVHDDNDLDRIYKRWKSSLFDHPLEEIRGYFGEGVALYLSFTQTYTNFLVIVALLGVTEFLLEKLFHVNYVYSNVLFSFVNLITIVVFLETWKRRGNEHSFYWGTAGKLRHKPPRPEYRGDLRKNPVTGREEMYYPKKKTNRKLYFVSIPLTLLCLLVAFWLMLFSFWAETAMAEYLLNPETGAPHDDLLSSVLANVPSVTYSLVILLCNNRYLKLARYLTEWENHRTQEQHDTHLANKLVLFEFVNTFLALFYVGFYLRDLPALRSQLLTTLVVQQIVNQVQQVLVPLVLQKPASVRLLDRVSRQLGVAEKPADRRLSIEPLDDSDPRVAVVRHDLMADPIDTVQEHFMEVWLQFGHVFLFLAVYPLAAVFALINNMMEVVSERYKLCRLSRKPRPANTRDIGAWSVAFRLTSVIAVMTNLALLAIDLKETAGREWTNLEWAAMFVVIEHVFLVAFVVTDLAIPDVPSHVKLAMDKTDWHFKQKPVRVTR